MGMEKERLGLGRERAQVKSCYVEDLGVVPSSLDGQLTTAY